MILIKNTTQEAHILEQQQKTTNLIEVTGHFYHSFFGGAVKNCPHEIEEFWTRRWESCQLHCGEKRHFDPSDKGFKWKTQTWDNQRLLHQKLGIQTKMQRFFWLVGTTKSEYLWIIQESLVQMYLASWLVCLQFSVFLKNKLLAGERGRLLSPSKALLAGLFGDPSLRNVPRGLQLDTQLHGLLKSPDMISTVDENLWHFSISDEK